MFSAAAWNALLKTLEEPPEDVVFILATTELQKVPLTVLSRALKFEFQKIGREVMQNYICDLCAKYQTGIEPGALSLVVTSAEGCMRDALSLLEQFIGCEELETETVREFLGLTSEEMIFDMLESMRDGDGTKALCIVEECEQRGKNMLLVVKAVLEALTYATAYRASGTLPAMSDLYRCRLKDFAESVPESRIEQFCGAFLQVYPLLARNVQLSFFLRALYIWHVSFSRRFSVIFFRGLTYRNIFIVIPQIWHTFKRLYISSITFFHTNGLFPAFDIRLVCLLRSIIPSVHFRHGKILGCLRKVHRRINFFETAP